MDNLLDVAELAPYGQATTYGDVAYIVGNGCDARIVGAAMAIVKDATARIELLFHRKSVQGAR